mmetsp:Transcript_27678/g.68123  ORF Transcript_27678/g.68123 Transcript_27678/m.68123 type:complete len:128 (+) Transcript_27678:85-468(+)|eukprot:CAMPEP_0197601406 /NCGR_PEP_ID=MMETSP1326-20131121/35238_1 /TAXON_ID=1155430 /ORGANISM="Genus nov. species nov., Strain RCC2288" /LENGTH=127 /DNA_ID=CAMNT_0043168637 /DNA_START=52 /DNA_END=435 /DNA_ORIENTATION=-
MAARGKARNSTFTVDCSAPVDRTVLVTSEFAEFLKASIKVAGKAGNLGDAVTVTSTSSAVSIQSALVKKDNASVAAVSKRYVRYLTKKYLAKEGLVEYLRVLADGPEGYKITFYNLGDDEEEEEADE